jgi:ubiquinone/menaquinone biosynthesis C-methylase UbiE
MPEGAGEPSEVSDATARQTEHLRQYYDKSAKDYDGWMRSYDRVMLGDARERICARALGETLEVAVGTGLNLPFYPRSVHLTAIDLSTGMLERARLRAAELDLSVNLRLGNVFELEFPDDSFDTVLSTLMMSSIPDERRAATEFWRVLKPGGKLLLLDHVRSPVAPVRWFERLIDPLLRRTTGVHLLRDPLDYLENLGFAVESCDRSRGGVIEEIVARKVSTPT